MVWARSRMMIWDYIFEPVNNIIINYVGPDSDTFYEKIHELIREIFNVPDAYIQEKDYTWEKGKEVQKFDVAWEVNKILDVFTYITIEIELTGFKSKDSGRCRIKLKPRLITEYPQDTIWQNSLFYEIFRRMWHRAFYHSKRMSFLALGKDLVVTFEREIKKHGQKIGEAKPDEQN